MKRLTTLATCSAALLLMAAAAGAQTVEVTQKFVDDAAKSFVEVVALRSTVEGQTQALRDKDTALAKKDDVIAKQDARFIAVLDILKEYATLDAKGKKGFWGKAKDKLVKLVDELTDPAVIREILLVVAVVKSGR